MNALAFNLVAASLLVVAILVVRRPVAKLFGAHAAYSLWLAPAARLVMPPLAAPSPVNDGDLLWVAVSVPAALERSAPAMSWLVPIWLGGALLFLAFHLLVHTRFVRRALAHGRALPVDGVAAAVIATPAVEGPVATGLVCRLILVPGDFEARFTPAQRQLALLHEQLHHRRGDIWACAAALLVAAALWFNPFTYVALVAFRRDMESSCDATVVACAGRERVPDYAETILASVARPVPRSLCALTSIDELKGRLMMLNLDHGTIRKGAGLLLAGAIAVVGLTAAAPSDQPKVKEEQTVEKKIVRHVVVKDSSGNVKEMEWTGDDGATMKEKCPGELTEISADDSSAKDKKEQAKIVICSTDGQGDRVAGLERALSEIRGDSTMDAGIKAQLVAKLEARIAELKAR